MLFCAMTKNKKLYAQAVPLLLLPLLKQETKLKQQSVCLHQVSSTSINSKQLPLFFAFLCRPNHSDPPESGKLHTDKPNRGDVSQQQSWFVCFSWVSSHHLFFFSFCALQRRQEEDASHSGLNIKHLSFLGETTWGFFLSGLPYEDYNHILNSLPSPIIMVWAYAAKSSLFLFRPV